MDKEVLSQILSLATLALEATVAASVVANRVHAMLSIYVEQGRDPTDAEIQEAFDRVKMLNDSIQSA